MNLIFLELINVILIGLAIIIIFVSILINFLESPTKEKVKKEKKSVVETGSMAGFFIVFYLVIRFRIGEFIYPNPLLRISLMILCWLILIIGIYFNVSGRFRLGKNWANQIRIYKTQTLVKTGVYSIVRHPLYASLIWMFYACSLIYLNWLAFLLNSFIFIPFMYHRAKIEEKALSEQFKNYKQYKEEVGMFFPKMRW